MELRHIRYFLAVADELHFGRAAKRLSITQPPLSLNIQQLEASIGARLFDRDSKGVRLTAAGHAFRKAAQALISNAEDARTLARDIHAGTAGRLRIGFVGSLLFRGLPGWFNAYRGRYPRIDVILSELNSHEQIDALLQDQIDVGFVHTSHVPTELQTAFVQASPFLCCIPAGHALAQCNKVSILQLRDEPFVLFSRNTSPDFYMRILEMFGAQGFYPRVRHEVRKAVGDVAGLAGHGCVGRAGTAGALGADRRGVQAIHRSDDLVGDPLRVERDPRSSRAQQVYR